MGVYLHTELTERIIGCAYEVHNVLGSGFLEKVYENALLEELRRSGIQAVPQHGVTVYYKGATIGEYVADLMVEGCVIVELKAVEKLHDLHEVQIKNYLRATGIEVGLLMNFGKSMEVRRKFVKNSNIL